jgi:hypothetical protein
MTTYSQSTEIILLTLITGGVASLPNIQKRDADFAIRPLSASDTTEENEERAVIAGLAVFVALLGFIVAFFVGYYVGMVTTRRTPTIVRATPYAVIETTATNAHHQQSSTPAPPQPTPPTPAPIAHRAIANPQRHDGLSTDTQNALDSYRIKRAQ